MKNLKLTELHKNEKLNNEKLSNLRGGTSGNAAAAAEAANARRPNCSCVAGGSQRRGSRRAVRHNYC